MKRSLINKVSPKRAKHNRQYSSLKKKFLAEHPLCARCELSEAADIHHAASREGRWLTLPRYFVGLCRLCHSSVHQYPASNSRFYILVTEDYATHVAKLQSKGINPDRPLFYERE